MPDLVQFRIGENVVQRVVEDRMSGGDYALVGSLLIAIVVVLLFRHRKRTFAACEDTQHSSSVGRYPLRTMKRKWVNGAWIRLCRSCWERRRDENGGA